MSLDLRLRYRQTYGMDGRPYSKYCWEAEAGHEATCQVDCVCECHGDEQ